MKHPTATTAAAAAAVLATLALSSTVLAQPAAPDPKAKELYEQGKRYYAVTDYAHAIEAWKQSYVIASVPILLFNIAQAYRLSGDCTHALQFYASYEREVGTPPNKDELDQAKARCVVATPPTTPPPDKPLHPTTAADLGQADLDRATAPAKPLPPVARDVGDPDAGHGYKVAAVATGAAGVALVVTGIVFSTKASNYADDVTSAKDWNAVTAGYQSSGQRDSLIGALTLSTGLAAVLAAPALYYLGTRDGHEHHHVGVAIAPGHAELTWAARF